ncbi:MAG: hypothetical protein IJN00_01075, partial [Clostridia bacterium]|nr:hypothetical protein [Clostridia bacterium]
PQNGSLSGKCKEEEEGISVDIPTDDDDAVARNGFVLRRCFLIGIPRNAGLFESFCLKYELFTVRFK